jgi:hypothetical protein
MEQYVKVVLFAHVLAGFSALITGVWAILVKKGGRTHRIVGKVFFYCMLIVAVTALGVAIPKKQTFLLMIAVFAFFQNYFGVRATQQRDMMPNLLDWIVLIIAAVNSFFMVYSFEIVLLVFGVISSSLTFGQFKIYLDVVRGREIPKMKWLRQHIGMMMGALIATITAFLLVNVRGFSPSWLPWLAPTAILVPLIIYYQRKYATSKI